MNTRLFSLAALATVSIALVSCSEQTDTRAPGSKRIKREIKYNKETFFDYAGKPGGSFTRTLTVNGKAYPDVTGLPPYYLEIPGKNAIVFATEPDPVSPATWHIYDFQTDTETIVTPHNNLFGRSIGVEGDLDNRSWIESSQSNVLVVANRFNRAVGKYTIDLTQKKVTNMEVFVYDKDGSLTNHYLRILK